MLEQNAYETVEQHMRVIEKQMPQRTGRTQFNVRDVPAVSWQMLKPSTMNNLYLIAQFLHADGNKNAVTYLLLSHNR